MVIVYEQAIRSMIASALTQLETETGVAIASSVDPATVAALQPTCVPLIPWKTDRHRQTQFQCAAHTVFIEQPHGVFGLHMLEFQHLV